MSEEITVKTPWLSSMGAVPAHLEYPDGSMYDAVEAIANQYPNQVAFDFMGRSTTYKQLIHEIQRCARSLKTIGVRESGYHCHAQLPPGHLYVLCRESGWRGLQYDPSSFGRKGNRVLPQ